MIDPNTWVIFYFYKDMPPLIDYMVGQRDDVKRKLYAELGMDKSKVKAQVYKMDDVRPLFAHTFTVTV